MFLTKLFLFQFFSGQARKDQSSNRRKEVVQDVKYRWHMLRGRLSSIQKFKIQKKKFRRVYTSASESYECSRERKTYIMPLADVELNMHQNGKNIFITVFNVYAMSGVQLN